MRTKAAFSDGLKRVAIHVRAARYLYRLPAQWLGYDGKAKRFTSKPQLPPWALPSARPAPASAASSKEAKALPASGAELVRRLTDYEAKLVAEGLCQQGDLSAHVVQTASQAGFGKDIFGWSAEAIRLAAEKTTEFEKAARRKAARQESSVGRLARGE